MKKRLVQLLLTAAALVLFGATTATTALAQVLSLDSCRRLALTNNKSIAISRAQKQKAAFDQQAAHTNYLPKVSLTAGYTRTGDEISLLNKDQKAQLNNLGTNAAGGLKTAAGQILAKYPELAPLAGGLAGALPQLAGGLDAIGRGIVDAFHTDTRNTTVGALMLTQPLYMGGKIRAYDRITRYAQNVADEQLRADGQAVVLEVDQAYWQVVSLVNKRRLAVSYRDMLKHLDDDVLKMIAQGVATKANELSVSVKLNEAEMTLTKVDDGLVLARMLLCQVCGLPLDSRITLADETLDDLPGETADAQADAATAFAQRPELRQLQTAADIYREKVNIERSAFLPQVALTGGYAVTNPSLFNGFERRFRGTWAVGIMLKVPVWTWGEMRYKVGAAKAEATVADLRLADAREKIELQVNQSAFRVNEANKQFALSLKNQEKAEENLRTAQLGFKEGIIPTSDLLAAQTAWVQAHSEKIDAQIDMKLTRATLNKALGTLTANDR